MRIALTLTPCILTFDEQIYPERFVHAPWGSTGLSRTVRASAMVIIDGYVEWLQSHSTWRGASFCAEVPQKCRMGRRMEILSNGLKDIVCISRDHINQPRKQPLHPKGVLQSCRIHAHVIELSLVAYYDKTRPETF